MRYELWDVKHRNLVFDSSELDRAVRAARQALDEGWTLDMLAIWRDDGSEDAEPNTWSVEGLALAKAIAALAADERDRSVRTHGSRAGGGSERAPRSA